MPGSRGRGTAVLASLVALAAIGLGGSLGAGGAAAEPPALIDWTELLPALPSPAQSEPNRVAHCRKPSIRCVSFQIRRMRELRDRLGCDHKAVFATTYLELTKVLYRKVRSGSGYFRWPRFFFREDALFANVYFRTVRRWEQGREVPPAWRIAFETAERGEVTAGQDLLLGVNAHVQNDMPFVLAELGLRDRDGRSRKPDHNRANDALRSGYEPVIAAVHGRYDPSLSLTNPEWTFAEDLVDLELVRLWREQVWRNAERLVNADSDAERERVAESIQAYAAGWARGMALVQFPGVRAERLEYCTQQLGQ